MSSFFLQVFFLLTSTAQAYERIDFRQKYVWTYKPTIVICSDSDVSIEIVQEALDFWKPFLFPYNEKIIRKKCYGNFYAGEIRIAGQRDLNTTEFYALTELDVNGFAMESAIIKFEKGTTDNLELLIHELGHGLGVWHSDESDESHIMHTHVVENPTRLK